MWTYWCWPHISKVVIHSTIYMFLKQMYWQTVFKIYNSCNFHNLHQTLTLSLFSKATWCNVEFGCWYHVNISERFGASLPATRLFFHKSLWNQNLNTFVAKQEVYKAVLPAKTLFLDEPLQNQNLSTFVHFSISCCIFCVHEWIFCKTFNVNILMLATHFKSSHSFNYIYVSEANVLANSFQDLQFM